MAEGKAFRGQAIIVGSESFSNCTFEGCTLTCNSEADFLRLKNCHFIACFWRGDGVPQHIKDYSNGPALEQMLAAYRSRHDH